MSAPNATNATGSPDAPFANTVPHHLRDEEGPVFAEPWQSQAFALAVTLHEAGCFAWSEWAETLGAVLAEAAQADAQAGVTDDGSRYYEHWLAALERLVSAKGLLDPASLARRKDAWEQAYLRTPHGQPVEL